ncbi:ribonuclease kappa [Phasianus colchicus]|uniref:ribonuclease kappa n=1 Tax=Phasianus colchicus TaxID=9054 RepID=UPI00129E9677|nr:ribonuclease kappa [Phasianus colchicus]
MVSLLCCGPKLAACGIVLSAWGVVMLVRGRHHNNTTPQQRPNTATSISNTFLSIHPSGPERIYGLYERVGTNCFVAAGLYLLLGGFALCQARLNKRKEYLVR